MSSNTSNSEAPKTNQWFEATHWTVILGAKDEESPAAKSALEKLCRTYWGALYAYIRRSGRSPADAADLTQAFLTRFLEKRFLQHVERDKGKFRTFLLKCLNHFLAEEWRHAHTSKRGGHHPQVSMNTDDWERRYAEEMTIEASPEHLYDRGWATALFGRALERVQEEAARAGKAREFELLGEFLSTPSEAGSYAEVARQLGVSEQTVAVQVHRLRRRFGELVRELVSETVSAQGEVEEELRYLLEILTR